LPAPVPPALSATLEAVVAAAGDRIVVAGDILEYAGFFVADQALDYDQAAFDKRLRRAPEAPGLLQRFSRHLAAVEPFTATALEAALHAFAAAEGIKIGQIIHALRVALTGKAVGFGLFEAMAILGRARCQARLQQALAALDVDGV
jgi:glutamyl-tRNA synthetase